MYKEAGSQDLFEQEQVDAVREKKDIIPEKQDSYVPKHTEKTNDKLAIDIDIERVVIFYSNNTFTEYHPQKLS
jgi:hypothetical protein